MKKKLVSVLLAAAMAMTVLPVTAAAEGNTLTYAISSECETLDPGMCNYLGSSGMIMNLFMGLYRADSTGAALTNGCAESYEVSEDGKTYTFHLYDDVLWSDGTPVTAGDFEYSWKRMLDPATASPAVRDLFDIKNAEAYNTGECSIDEVGIKATDDTTLVVELENPTSYFIEKTAVASLSPVNKAAVEGSSTWSQKAETFVNNGAFIVEEINPEESYVLKKNPNYKYADEVKLDGVKVVFMAQGTSTLTALKNGEIDMTNNISTQAQAEFSGTDQLLDFDCLGTSYYDINCENLTDARARKAMSMALDRDMITQSLVASKPKPATGFVPAGLSYYDSDDDYRTVVGDLITYDVDGAKELLEEAKADGFDADATYEIIIKNDDELKLIAQAMQAMWKQNLGLNFTITTYESGSYWDEFYDGNFDVAFDGWTGDYDDPNTMLECFTQKACATQNRWSGEKAEEYDQIIADCATMTDQTERYAKFAEAEKILMDESPILPLYYRKSQLLVGTNVAKAVNDTLGHTLLMYTELS